MACNALPVAARFGAEPFVPCSERRRKLQKAGTRDAGPIGPASRQGREAVRSAPGRDQAEAGFIGGLPGNARRSGTHLRPSPRLPGRDGEGEATRACASGAPSLTLQPKSDLSDFGHPLNAEFGQARFRVQAGEGTEAPRLDIPADAVSDGRKIARAQAEAR